MEFSAVYYWGSFPERMVDIMMTNPPVPDNLPAANCNPCEDQGIVVDYNFLSEGIQAKWQYCDCERGDFARKNMPPEQVSVELEKMVQTISKTLKFVAPEEEKAFLEEHGLEQHGRPEMGAEEDPS